MQNNSPKEIYQAIQAASSILINMDTRTDFDALSSAVLFSRILPQINKSASSKIIHAKKIGPTYQGLFDFTFIETETDISTYDLTSIDLVVHLDSGDQKHTTISPDFNIPSHLKTINIDHHSSNDYFGTYNYVKYLGSCCSVLYELYKEWEIVLNVGDLNIFVPGMLTDTGFLQYNTATPTDFRIIADLIENGVNFSDIVFKLNQSQPIDEVRFKELIYNHLTVDFEKRFGYSFYTVQDLQERGIDLEKVVVRHSDVIKTIKDLDFVFVVDEEKHVPGSYGVSFRTCNNKTPVVEFAKALGGGGHEFAAGARLGEFPNIQEAVRKVLSILNNA